VALLVPLLALLAVTTYQVRSAAADAREASRLADGAELGLAAFDLIDVLQAERAALAADEPLPEGSRASVERAASALRARAAAVGGELEARAERALRRADAAGALAATGTGGIVAIDGYTPAIDELLAVARGGFDPGSAVDDQPANATDALAAAQEAAALERDLVTAMSRDPSVVPLRFPQVGSLAAEQRILVEQASRSAAADLGVRADVVSDRLAAADDQRRTLFSADTTGEAVAAWTGAADDRIADLTRLRDEAALVAVATVDALAASARQVLALSGLAVLATLLVTGLLVRSAIRSIAEPLQDLAAQAEQVAQQRLPEAMAALQSDGVDATEVHLPAVRASGAIEVQEVAAAFNEVQDTALRLAGEQALLRRNLGEALTNLGRRNQALLGRQLDFISELEKRETDPAFLDHLFKLDHLASRMRRNAESLLILAGSETPRRRRRPAEVAEVVRAAMSEVEDFGRVRLGHLGPATLAGPVVIDLVHLLAELIENGLAFSPPDTTVEIDGRSLGQGGYQLAVVDHGVGMSNVELVAANQRLAGLAEVDGMPTRYLGQYVIAKLAAKTGAIVRLQPSVGGRGITAVVSLPESAVVGGADRSSVALPLPGSRAAREQGPEPFAPGAGLSGTVHQPDPVVDASADPFVEPVPRLDGEPSTGAGAFPAPAADASAPTAIDRLWEPLSPVVAPGSDDHAGPADTPPPPPPVTAPQQDWRPPPAAPADPVPAPAPPASGSRLGGLTRRVPGASLADSPLAAPVTAAERPADRSAEEVRSMLSSLQSGRARGRSVGAGDRHDPADPSPQGPDALGASGPSDEEQVSPWEDFR
jgi:signal transduction histidine kinase